MILFHLTENKTEYDLEFPNSPHKFIDIETKEEAFEEGDHVPLVANIKIKLKIRRKE